MIVVVVGGGGGGLNGVVAIFCLFWRMMVHSPIV